MVKLHFLTRDIKNDYPRIGWLPSLPDDAPSLWEKFGNWQQQEYPQIILKQKNGAWQLLLTAINSGRTDSITPNANARVIRISLFLTGNTTEGNSVLGLIEYFLKEALTPDASGELQKIFQETIKNDDPSIWSQAPSNDQEAIASEIYSKLEKLTLSLPCKESPWHDKSPERWRAGWTSKNIPCFLGFCKDILNGQKNGCAISLANLGDCDVPKLLNQLPSNDDMAILLSGSDERGLPIEERDLPQKESRTPNNSTQRQTVLQILKDGPFRIFALAIMILVLTCCIIYNSCSGKKYTLTLTNATAKNFQNELKANQEVTLTATVPEEIDENECLFLWESQACEDIQGKTTREVTFNMPKCDVDAVAKVELKKYTVEIIGGLAQLDGERIGSAPKGVTLNVKIDQDQKSFKGWEADGVSLPEEQISNPDISFTMPGNKITLKAIYDDAK